VIKGLTDAELGAILGVTSDLARKVRTRRIKSLKLEAALWLARELKISPWYLAGEPEPPTRSGRTSE
jgi:transcriptional regulator with XRE-family HTH domain